MHRILKNGEAYNHKLFLLEKQDWICSLCETRIEITDSALDHCHATGFIREVLHDRCNRALGFIEWSIGVTGDQETFLTNVAKYLNKHSIDPSLVYHHRHFAHTEFRQSRKLKPPRFEIKEADKKLYLQALADGPTPHPKPKKHTSPIGSWKRTAEKYGINHGRLLAYVNGERPKTELEIA
jgi:hypothetical protein